MKNKYTDETIQQIIADYEKAAGELLVDIPEPGTDLAKLLHANVMMRKYKIPELEQEVRHLKQKQLHALHVANELGWKNQKLEDYIRELQDELHLESAYRGFRCRRCKGWTKHKEDCKFMEILLREL